MNQIRTRDRLELGKVKGESELLGAWRLPCDTNRDPNHFYGVERFILSKRIGKLLENDIIAIPPENCLTIYSELNLLHFSSFLSLSLLEFGRVPFSVRAHEYSEVRSKIIAGHAGRQPGVCLYLPDSQYEFYDFPPNLSDDEYEERLEFEKGNFLTIYHRLADSFRRVLYTPYITSRYGALNQLDAGRKNTFSSFITDLNSFVESVVGESDNYFDLGGELVRFGHERAFDRKLFYDTKQRLTADAQAYIADRLVEKINVIEAPKKKVLAVDFDNTLWQGFVGEDDSVGVSNTGGVPEAHYNFQKYLKWLRASGVLLVGITKNQPRVVTEFFLRTQNMPLKYDDFSLVLASYQPKYMMIREAAEALNLNLDTFVYVDDEPYELGSIGNHLKTVTLCHYNKNLQDVIERLDRSFLFDRTQVTDEDKRRADNYKTTLALQEASRGSPGDLIGYLKSLEMTVVLRPAIQGDLIRVKQLLDKSNQFNFTGRRFSNDELKDYFEGSAVRIFISNLSDKYTEYGIVAVVLMDIEKCEVINMVMSCRVLGRMFEELVLESLAEMYSEIGGDLTINYLRTAKNRLAEKFLMERLNVSELADGAHKFSPRGLSTLKEIYRMGSSI